MGVVGGPKEFVGEMLWGGEGMNKAGSYGRIAKCFVDWSKVGLVAYDCGVVPTVGWQFWRP